MHNLTRTQHAVTRIFYVSLKVPKINRIFYSLQMPDMLKIFTCAVVCVKSVKLLLRRKNRGNIFWFYIPPQQVFCVTHKRTDLIWISWQYYWGHFSETCSKALFLAWENNEASFPCRKDSLSWRIGVSCQIYTLSVRDGLIFMLFTKIHCRMCPELCSALGRNTASGIFSPALCISGEFAYHPGIFQCNVGKLQIRVFSIFGQIFC